MNMSSVTADIAGVSKGFGKDAPANPVLQE